MTKRPLGPYLEWNNGTIRVVISVPRPLQAKLGKTKLKESLGTDSPARAEVLKWVVIQKLKAELAAATTEQGDPLVAEAMEWRKELAQPGRDDEGRDNLSTVLIDRAEEIERSRTLEEAQAFVAIAKGERTPFITPLETYLAESTLKPRTKGEVRFVTDRLSKWCARSGTPPTIEAMSRKTAGRFVSEALVLAYPSARTRNKQLSFLSSYWKWLSARGYVEDERNPWLGQSAKVERRSVLAEAEGGDERPFTDEEAVKLLFGPASPRNHDVMWLAAFSGMRIDEVCRLRVGDCEGGWFQVNARRGVTGEGKTRASVRKVPIHSAIREIVEERSKGKGVSDYLIDGLTEPKPGEAKERSQPASKEFTRYRRALKVDERSEGRRRSAVNFHSWRRWFAMKARNAGDHYGWALAELLGHDTKSLPLGLTMSRYAGPQLPERLIECVEAVKVPSRGGDAARAA